MHKIITILVLVATMACTPSGESPKAYAAYIAGFEEQFQEIEAQYDHATPAEQEELEADYERLELALVEAQKAFIQDNPDSLRSVFLLYEIDWSFKSLEDFWVYINMIDETLHGNEYYIRLVRLTEQAEKVELGKIAPDFQMPDTSGEHRRLSEVLDESDYLLLDFWASNCSPCRHENPYILAAYEEFNDRGFNVLGVSTDTQKDAWLKAIHDDSLVWTNVCSFEKWNDHPVVLLYALSQTSQNFLLDKDGVILAKDLRGEALNEKLSELLD